jgi:multidrug efflux pump subunit AcrA (membrane-fusion protein)
LETDTVRYSDVPIAIEARGDLAPVETSQMICHVRAMSGSPYATSIRWVIEQGTWVTQGQLLVQLDDSQLKEDLATRRAPLEQARSDWVQAVENRKIIASQAQGDIEAAEGVLRLAELDLKKYVEADHDLTRKDILGRLSLAEADVQAAREHFAYMQRMGRKGFMSASQVRADQMRMEKMEQTVELIREEQRVLDKYGHPRTLAELEGKVADAQRGVALAKAQARCKMIQADSDHLSKHRVYQTLLNRYHEIEAEVAKCRITAPHDGLVLHFLSEQSRNSRGNYQAFVAEGEPVREGQVLLSVVQLKQMVVRSWVHEALIGHVHGEADVPSRSRLQQALIRVDAYPGRVLHGHVKVVGTIPSMINGRMDGTLAFQTTIAIDDPVDDLRPDMTAHVTILTDDETPKNVLTVPVDAILPGIGPHRKCYVLKDDEPEEREITVGLYNDELVQIVSGLEEGEEVVVNPEEVTDEESHHGGPARHHRAHRR